MATVVWAAEGVSKFEDILDYLAEHSPNKVEEVRSRILTGVGRLAMLPLMGRVVPEFNLDHLRELIQSPYRILYIVRGDVCSIVGVFHSRRNLASLVHPEEFEDNGHTAE